MTRGGGDGPARVTYGAGQEPSHMKVLASGFDAYCMHGVVPMPLRSEARLPHDAPRPEPPRAGRRWSPRPKHGVDGPTCIASSKGPACLWCGQPWSLGHAYGLTMPCPTVPRG